MPADEAGDRVAEDFVDPSDVIILGVAIGTSEQDEDVHGVRGQADVSVLRPHLRVLRVRGVQPVHDVTEAGRGRVVDPADLRLGRPLRRRGRVVDDCPVLLLRAEALFFDAVGVEHGNEVVLLMGEGHKVRLLHVLQEAQTRAAPLDVRGRAEVGNCRPVASRH